MSIIYRELAEHFQGNKDDQDIDPDLQESYKLPEEKKKMSAQIISNPQIFSLRGNTKNYLSIQKMAPTEGSGMRYEEAVI